MISQNLSDLLSATAVDLSTKNEVLLDLAGYTKLARGKNAGKYQCPCCGETKLSVKGGKGTTCYHCGAGATDVFRALKAELGVEGKQRKEFPKFIPIATGFGKKEDALTANQWTDAIASLMKLMPLTYAHRSYLKEKRGMTDEAIASATLFSIPEYEFDVTGVVPKNFPGTRWKDDGRQYLQPRRTQGADGQWQSYSQIFHVARGAMGDYIGGQALCPYIEKSGEGNKYRNLIKYDGNASNSKVEYHSSPEQFLTYETPFNSGERDNYPDYIFFVDSDAGKPMYASTKHGISVAGMRAANFHASPQLLYSTLLVAMSVQGKSTVVLAPDHGDFPCKEKPDGNLNMIGNWVKTYKAMKSMFPEVSVLVRVSVGCDLDEDERVGHSFISFLEYLQIQMRKSAKVKARVQSLTKVSGLMTEVARVVSKKIKEKSSSIVLASTQQLGSPDNLLAPRCDLIPDYIEWNEELDFTDIIALNKHAIALKLPVPKILFHNQSDREKVLAAASSAGWKYTKDTSRTGSGKTYDALNHYTGEDALNMLGHDREAIMAAGAHDNGRVFYLCASPLNVTVEHDFYVMPSRTEGLHVGEGDRIYTRPKKDTVPHPLGYANCGLASTHRSALELGIRSDISKEIICGSCPARESCISDGATVDGIASGYLIARASALEEETQVICHPSQVPQRNIAAQQRGLGSSDLVFIDDVNLETSSEKKVSMSAIDNAIATATISIETMRQNAIRNSSDSPEFVQEFAKKRAACDRTIKALTVVKNVLKSFDIKQSRYGWTPKEVRDRLTSELALIGIDVADIYGSIQLMAIGASVSSETGWTIQTDENRKDWAIHRRKQASSANKLIDQLYDNAESLALAFNRASTPEQYQEATKEHGRLRWVSSFFESFSNPNIAVSIGIDGSEPVLEIIRPDYSQVNRLKSAGMIVHMDATSGPEDFARTMGIGREQVLHIEQKTTGYPNLTYINLVAKQKYTRERWGNHQIKQVDAVACMAQNKFGRTALITYKRQVEGKVVTSITPELQGYWGRDNRGTNRYQDCDALILVGSPIANMNSKACQLQVTTGQYTDHSASNTGRFFKELHKDAMEEKLQAIGRLRANRTTSPRTAISVTGQRMSDRERQQIEDRFPGINIVEMLVEDFIQESVTNRVHDNMVAAIANNIRSGLRPIQDSIAQQLGVTDRTLRNLCRDHGGWKQLQRMVGNAVNMIAPNQLSKAGEEMKQLAQLVVPEKFAQWRESIAQAEKIAEESSLWLGERIQELADKISTASFEAIACLTQLSPKQFEQAVGCMSDSDQQALWEIILSLEPLNFHQLRLWEKAESFPIHT